jgi:hypothetical protein
VATTTMSFVYPRRTVEYALLLSSLGVTDRENAQVCGVSIRTIRHWRYGTRQNAATVVARCPRCDGKELAEDAYAYLLGLYLGDGHITHGRRDVYALNVKCSNAWPALIEAAQSAMAAVMPTSSVFCVARPGCVEVKSWSKHWPCLFPQHGPGRKHTRMIALAAGNRRNLPRSVRAGPVSLRRLPRHQPRPPESGRRRSLVRISALLPGQ